MKEYNYKMGEIVYVNLHEDLKGKAMIVGCATIGAAVIGKAYIIEPLDFSVYSDVYPFKTCICFESQMIKIKEGENDTYEEDVPF